jgi:hypothetical protein
MNRIPEPVSPAQMASLTPDERNQIITQRNHDIALATLAETATKLGDEAALEFLRSQGVTLPLVEPDATPPAD